MANMIKPPNEKLRNGDTNNGFLPLTKGSGTVAGPNQSMSPGPRGGCMPLTGHASPISPPNENFGAFRPGSGVEAQIPFPSKPMNSASPLKSELGGMTTGGILGKAATMDSAVASRRKGGK